MKEIIRKFIRKIGSIAYPNNLGNIKVEIQRMATAKTAQFVMNKMSNVKSVNNWQAVHDIAGKYANQNGLVLEFGVFSAKTTNYIATIFADNVVHGFDSFEGLPELWRDGYDKGKFFVDALPEVRSNVVLHKGWFDQSIPTFLEENKTEQGISYIHVDCDMYSSTKTIFDKLKHLFVDGTIIVFDEYFNYPGWEIGEYLAFEELIEEGVFSFEYITYNYMHEQVAVRLIKL